MSEPEFDKDIELALLQIKVSNKQTDSYALIGVNLSLFVGFLAMAAAEASGSVTLFGHSGYTFALVLGISACVFLGVAVKAVYGWWKFQSVIDSDFDKIYRKEKINWQD